MLEGDVKAVVIIAGLHWALASPPPGLGWSNSINRAEAHLVKFTLRHHTFHLKFHCFTSLNALYTKVKPGTTVAYVCERLTVAIHEASQDFRILTR